MKIEKVIFGRLNSERLPNKLIKDINGTCLWEIACKKFPDAYFVCCEKELIDIAENCGVKVIERNPLTINKDEPLNYIFMDVKKIDATHLLWINPCLLFLKPETIDKVISFAKEEEVDYVESIKRFNSWLYDEEGNLMTQLDFRKLNTKDLPPYWEGAHAFRMFPKKKFLGTGKMLDKDHEVFPITEEESVDVDTELDFEIAKVLHRHRWNNL